MDNTGNKGENPAKSLIFEGLAPTRQPRQPSK
jgi:hypothetical protein